MEKTYYPKQAELTQEWFVVDAAGKNLGRLSSQIAAVLLGKHKPTYTPGVDTGAHVVVLNCGGITVTGNKLEDKKYYRHTGYPGGIRETSLKRQLEKHPERVIEKAVWGMLPHNRHGHKLMKKLKLYTGSEHPHAAQNPQPLAIQE
ncbi:MAG: 50S ribosomal protein L13 [Anaerolineae bacterium]|nr:MAG: 50S ribosomal protein L13 [Anaerolineae bacterium]